MSQRRFPTVTPDVSEMGVFSAGAPFPSVSSWLKFFILLPISLPLAIIQMATVLLFVFIFRARSGKQMLPRSRFLARVLAFMSQGIVDMTDWSKLRAALALRNTARAPAIIANHSAGLSDMMLLNLIFTEADPKDYVCPAMAQSIVPFLGLTNWSKAIHPLNGLVYSRSEGRFHYDEEKRLVDSMRLFQRLKKVSFCGFPEGLVKRTKWQKKLFPFHWTTLDSARKSGAVVCVNYYYFVNPDVADFLMNWKFPVLVVAFFRSLTLPISLMRCDFVYVPPEHLAKKTLHEAVREIYESRGFHFVPGDPIPHSEVPSLHEKSKRVIYKDT